MLTNGAFRRSFFGLFREGGVHRVLGRNEKNTSSEACRKCPGCPYSFSTATTTRPRPRPAPPSTATTRTTSLYVHVEPATQQVGPVHTPSTAPPPAPPLETATNKSTEAKGRRGVAMKAREAMVSEATVSEATVWGLEQPPLDAHDQSITSLRRPCRLRAEGYTVRGTCALVPTREADQLCPRPRPGNHHGKA